MANRIKYVTDNNLIPITSSYYVYIIAINSSLTLTHISTGLYTLGPDLLYLDHIPLTWNTLSFIPNTKMQLILYNPTRIQLHALSFSSLF